MKYLWTPVILLLLLGLTVTVAQGQASHGFQFTWTDPVTRTDGTAVTVDELATYRLKCEGVENVERIITRDQAEVVNGEMTYWWDGAVQQGGWYDCSMTVTDVNALESDSSEIVRVRKLARPNPPSLRGAAGDVNASVSGTVG
jgi:hypothetical protein